MRRKGQSVRPGDVTHEEVALDFKNLYIQRDLLKQLGMNKQEQRSPFLTQLFKVHKNTKYTFYNFILFLL